MQDNLDHREGVEEEEFDLFQLLFDIVDGIHEYGWFMLALISLVGTICYFTARVRYVPYYETHTNFTVNPVSTVNYNSSGQKNNVTKKIGEVFPSFLESDALKSLVMEDMGYVDDQKLPAEISASVVKNTNLVTLSVRSEDPQIAYDVLRSVIRNYPSISEVAIGEVSLMQMSETGLPTAPANKPVSKKAAAAGMLICFMICMAVIVIKSVRRKTIRTESELTRYFNVQYLGNLPSAVFKKRSRNEDPVVTIDTEGIPFDFVEAVRTIRHRVEREAQKNNAKVILVTSALEAEGKTTTAVNLAIALSNRKKKVILLDGDLRNPSVMDALGLEPADRGVVDLLQQECKPGDILKPYKNKKYLALLPGGKPVDNPTALWSSASTRELIRDLRETCDYIIIDAPPSAIVSDASLIARIADGCVYVIRQDYAGIDALREGMEMFTGTGCKLLGCVLNLADAGEGGYGYGRYGYGRYGYGRYGYGKYGYGKYGYGKSGYGYGYGSREDSGKKKTEEQK